MGGTPAPYPCVYGHYIRQRIIFSVLAMIHKMKLGLLPPYLSQNLQYVRDVQPYNLRSNSKFRLPAFTSNIGQNSLFYNGVSLYNQMMDEIIVDSKTNFLEKSCNFKYYCYFNNSEE